MPDTSQDADVTRVLEAVAELDTFADGPNDDPFCPFDCGWEQYTRETHDDDCPIAIARRLTEA